MREKWTGLAMVYAVSVATSAARMPNDVEREIYLNERRFEIIAQCREDDLPEDEAAGVADIAIAKARGLIAGFLARRA
ncbi:MAG TPA: hypothetical protein VK433_10565 [Stellaceae bacterium]|nr:hypothetical protein [Stellaceae bacterium]